MLPSYQTAFFCLANNHIIQIAGTKKGKVSGFPLLVYLCRNSDNRTGRLSMAQDNDDSNLEQSHLDLIRIIDSVNEQLMAGRFRNRPVIKVKDKENGIYKTSRTDISEIMPINKLIFLLIPEIDKAKERDLLEKHIIHAIECHDLKCAYVVDTTIPFANLTANQKRCTEISLKEFTRIYEYGRLYHGAEKHIQRWNDELNRVSQEYKKIKGISLSNNKNKRPSTDDKDQERREIYQQVVHELGIKTHKGILLKEAAKRAVCSEKTMRRAISPKR